MHWTKRPKDRGVRQWEIIGEQADLLRTLLERAGQMLKKSGLNNELSILLLTEPVPLKRWWEHISGGCDLRVDGQEREGGIESISGRLLNAANTSKRVCEAIEVRLT